MRMVELAHIDVGGWLRALDPGLGRSQAAPIAQVAIGRAPGETGLRVTALLPAAVSFPSSFRIGLEERDATDLVLDALGSP